MRGQWISSLFLTLLVGGAKMSAAETCDTVSLQHCFFTLQELMDDQFRAIKKTENELNVYCQTIDKDGGCLADASGACKKEHPLIETLSEALQTYTDTFCKEGTEHRELYMKVIPCLVQNEAAFKSCEIAEFQISNDTNEQLQQVCQAQMENKECIVDASVTNCGEDGKKIVLALQAPGNKLFQDFCSGTGRMEGYNFSLILAAFLLITLLRHRA